MAETILVTGAAGKLGAMLRPALVEAGYMVRLTDQRLVHPLSANERFIRARLERAGQMRLACRGAQALIHLGAVSHEEDWPTLLAANGEGLITTLEAARAEGVRRIVFASSMHAIGMHPRTESVDESSLPAPDTRYGATKVFGEAVCRLFAEKYGLTVVVLRLGHVVRDMADAAPGQGIAAEDMCRLFLLGLSIQAPGFHLFHAVAPHQDYPLSDGRLARRHGFVFRHCGPDRATVLRLLNEDPKFGEVARTRHGGDFAETP